MPLSANNVIPLPLGGASHAKATVGDLPVSLRRLGLAVRELDDLRHSVKKIAGAPRWSAGAQCPLPRGKRTLCLFGADASRPSEWAACARPLVIKIGRALPFPSSEDVPSGGLPR